MGVMAVCSVADFCSTNLLTLASILPKNVEILTVLLGGHLTSYSFQVNHFHPPPPPQSIAMVRELAKWCGVVVVEMTHLRACVCGTVVATMT